MREDEYKTLAAEARGLYKEKGSRFLAFAYNVEDSEQAKAIVRERQKEFHDARHHCYAWRIGPGEGETRSSDDGEPSGTAGRPILGQIVSAGLTNVLVVVVRYFGGIKLGTGGLIVAYRDATADAFANAQTEVRTFNDKIVVLFPYSAMNDVMKAVKDIQPKVTAQEFGNDCRLSLTVRQADSPTLKARLGDIEGCIVEEA